MVEALEGAIDYYKVEHTMKVEWSFSFGSEGVTVSWGEMQLRARPV